MLRNDDDVDDDGCGDRKAFHFPGVVHVEDNLLVCQHDN